MVTLAASGFSPVNLASTGDRPIRFNCQTEFPSGTIGYSDRDVHHDSDEDEMAPGGFSIHLDVALS